MNRSSVTFPRSLLRSVSTARPGAWVSDLALTVNDPWGRLARLGGMDDPRANELDRHFHQVVVGRGQTGEPVMANIELAPLTSLAEELGRTLVPVQPPPRFRQDLGAALTDAHRQRMAQRTLGTTPPAPRQRQSGRGIWLIGLLVVVGLLIWRRQRRGIA